MYEEMEDKYVQAEKMREKEKKFWSTEEIRKEENPKEILQETYKLIEDEYTVLRPPLKGVSEVLTIKDQVTIMNRTASQEEIGTPIKRASMMGNNQEPKTSTMISIKTPITMHESSREFEGRREKYEMNRGKISEINSKIKALSEKRKYLIKEGKEILSNKEDLRPREARGKPRVISNIQLRPPREEYRRERDQGNRYEIDPGVAENHTYMEVLEDSEPEVVEETGQQDNEWTKITHRGERNRKNSKGEGNTNRRERSRNGTRLRRPSRTAVVAIRARNDEISYAEVLRKARQEVPP